MSHPSYDHQKPEQLHARQVGGALPEQQPLQLFEAAARAGLEIDQQVERVRWLMRREPMLETGEQRVDG